MKAFVKKPNWLVKNFNKILLVLLLSIVINLIVYKGGGTQYAWTHLSFIVIIIAAYYWQIKGSLAVAILLGITMGPFMPFNLSGGVMQTTLNWMLRLLIYLFIAFIAGYLFHKNNKTNKLIIEKEFIDSSTGLYNKNKLFNELNILIDNDEKFCLVFFNILNLDDISKYVDYNMIEIIISKVIEHQAAYFKGKDLYSHSSDEYIFVLKEYDENCIIQKISECIKEGAKLLEIDGYSFKLIAKTGIVFNNDGITTAKEIYNKARIAADQGEIYQSGIYIYSDSIKKEKVLFNEISGSLKNAIKNNEFYLVYQPIIDLKKSEISEVEVLLRWNRGKREPVGPQLFIPIAERIGLINKITKWIIEKTINQNCEWEKKAIEIMTTINVTGSEIEDNSFRELIEKIIEKKGVNRNNIGIELTERAVMGSGINFSDVLFGLRKKGYKILIDDFGTGYNSLMTALEIPFDIIKIDKYFIDELNKTETKLLVRHIIELVHEIGGTIIAEGVETKEQLLILKEFGCDMIQGYYFSKPLLPEEFTKYYETFDMNKYI